MENTEDKPKAFKVDDRRRFSAEGELKPEHRSGNQPEAGSAHQASSPGNASSVGEGQSGPRGAPEGNAPAHEPPPELTFAGFIVSLSTQALLQLGEIVDPATSENRRDLVGAQQIIDILGMLREKTRGNLDRDEEGLLDSILFDLRMKYVEIARQGAR